MPPLAGVRCSAPCVAAREAWVLERVAALGDDSADCLPEPFPDDGEGRFATLVLGAVMEEGGDHLVARAAVLHDEGGDGEEAGEVRDLRALAMLVGVKLGSQREGLGQTGALVTCHR